MPKLYYRGDVFLYLFFEIFGGIKCHGGTDPSERSELYFLTIKTARVVKYVDFQSESWLAVLRAKIQSPLIGFTVNADFTRIGSNFEIISKIARIEIDGGISQLAAGLLTWFYFSSDPHASILAEQGLDRHKNHDNGKYDSQFFAPGPHHYFRTDDRSAYPAEH